MILAVDGEAALRAIAARLEKAGVPHVLVEEPDPPYFGAATAIGCVPAPRGAQRKVLSNLPCLR